jgi:hypothetical protein
MPDDLEPDSTPTPCEHAIGLAACPICLGRGRREDIDGTMIPCVSCVGSGKVTLQRHHELVGLRRTSQIDLERVLEEKPK